MKKSSEKSFGIVFSVVFLIVSLWPVLDSNQIRLPWLIVSAILLLLSFLKPVLLKPFNLLWMKIGALLGKIVPPIVMLVIFFVIVTPIGIVLKIFKKDLLGLNFSDHKSYWQKRKTNITTMDKQF
tara:strand:+ start:525 stop:899 length:375 start_codon:yes stop_codon:yes gene_type:complete